MRTGQVSTGAALLTALAASSCCVGPVILAAFGLGGAGLLARLGAYRLPMLVVTAVCLGAGFYFTYRKRKSAEGDACGCERPKAGRLSKVLLWVASVVTLVVAAAPSVLPKLLAFGVAHAAPSGPVATAVMRLDGIDCEACAAPIRKALIAVGGFNDLHLDVRRKMVSVSYEPGPGRPDVYLKAIDDLGYEARLSTVSEPQQVPR